MYPMLDKVKSIKLKVNPSISDVMIDRLTFTFGYPSEIGIKNKEKLQEEAIQYLDDGGLWAEKKGYKYAKRIPISLNTKTLIEQGLNPYSAKDKYVHISLEPYNTQNRFMRVDCNPNNINMAELMVTLNTILGLDYAKFDGCDYIKKYSNVTRLDLAVDIGRDIDSLMYYAKKKRYSKIITSNGKSLYLGMQSSDNFFRIYDKEAQLKYLKSKSDIDQDFQEALPTKSITRIEVTYRPNLTISEMVKEQKNHFKSLTISQWPKAKIGDTVYMLFRKVCSHEGVNSALQDIDNNYSRNRMKKEVEKMKVKWWKPEKFDSQIQSLCENVFEIE